LDRIDSFIESIKVSFIIPQYHLLYQTQVIEIIGLLGYYVRIIRSAVSFIVPA